MSSLKSKRVSVPSEEGRKFVLAIVNDHMEGSDDLFKVQQEAHMMTYHVMKQLWYQPAVPELMENSPANTLLNYSVKELMDGKSSDGWVGWNKWVSSLRPADDLIVHYSGHGCHFDGLDYLVTPKKEHVCVQDLVAQVALKGVSSCIMFFEACRIESKSVVPKTSIYNDNKSAIKKKANIGILFSTQVGKVVCVPDVALHCAIMSANIFVTLYKSVGPRLNRKKLSTEYTWKEFVETATANVKEIVTRKKSEQTLHFQELGIFTKTSLITRGKVEVTDEDLPDPYAISNKYKGQEVQDRPGTSMGEVLQTLGAGKARKAQKKPK